MCDSCEYEDLLDKINELTDDESFEWASDTLHGIHDTVESRSHATERQWEAVENIERSQDR